MAVGAGFIISFRRVSRNRVIAQTTDCTNSAVPRLEIKRWVVLDSGIFRGFSRLAYSPTTRVVASVFVLAGSHAVVLVPVSEMNQSDSPYRRRPLKKEGLEEFLPRVSISSMTMAVLDVQLFHRGARVRCMTKGG